MKIDVPRIAIYYHTDPAARIASGIDSFIRGILRHAPDDLHYTLVGASTDPVRRPPGKLLQLDVDGRVASFLPLIAIDSEGRRGALPLTAHYLAALVRHRLAGAARHFDILDFHRIEPLGFFRKGERPMNLTLHQDMVVIRDPRSDIMWRHLPWLYDTLEKRLKARADRVFCVRRSAVQRYQREDPARADRYAFIPTWFDRTRFFAGTPPERAALRLELRTRFGWPAAARVLISVGRLDPQKDPLRLLETVLPLMTVDADMRLLLVGDGALRERVETQIADSGLGSRIALVGARHGNEIAQLLKGADVFALSSAYEGMPIALLEALACGVPVAATPVGEVPTLIHNGINGQLATDTSASALRQALQQLLAAPLPDAATCAASVKAYEPEAVLAAIYDNHRRQAKQLAPVATGRTEAWE